MSTAHLQDLNAALKVWSAHIDDAIKSSRPDQSRIQHISPALAEALVREERPLGHTSGLVVGTDLRYAELS